MSADPTLSQPYLAEDASIPGVLQQIDAVRRWAADPVLHLEDVELDLATDDTVLAAMSLADRASIAAAVTGEALPSALEAIAGGEPVRAFARRLAAILEAAAAAPVRAKVAHKEVVRLSMALSRAGERGGADEQRARDGKVVSDQAREELLAVPHRLARARVSVARALRRAPAVRPRRRPPTRELPAVGRRLTGTR